MQEILEVSCRPVHDGIWTPAELMGALDAPPRTTQTR